MRRGRHATVRSVFSSFNCDALLWLNSFRTVECCQIHTAIHNNFIHFSEVITSMKLFSPHCFLCHRNIFRNTGTPLCFTPRNPFCYKKNCSWTVSWLLLHSMYWWFRNWWMELIRSTTIFWTQWHCEVSRFLKKMENYTKLQHQNIYETKQQKKEFSLLLMLFCVVLKHAKTLHWRCHLL